MNSAGSARAMDSIVFYAFMIFMASWLPFFRQPMLSGNSYRQLICRKVVSSVRKLALIAEFVLSCQECMHAEFEALR